MYCNEKQVASSLQRGGDLGTVKMLYRGNGSVQIRGPVTGQIYLFPRQQPVQAVDPRDVSSLIRTRLFRPIQ